MPLDTAFNNLSVSAQNCNSLNLTGVSTNLESKIGAITSVKSDLIFISDIRLVSSNGISNEERVRTAIRDSKYRSYEGYFNSNKNSRGVGILVANDINFTIIEQKIDLNQNYIILKASLNGSELILASIYGPNGADRQFFHEIERNINQLRGETELPVILGGTGTLRGIAAR